MKRIEPELSQKGEEKLPKRCAKEPGAERRNYARACAAAQKLERRKAAEAEKGGKR